MKVAGNLPDIVAIRDCKSPELLFRPAEWRASISGVKDGDSTEHLNQKLPTVAMSALRLRHFVE
ncbi:DUF397 domain-containing protein [Microtetraspora malaysiensis]|uniref:DUF397 domain-containing protein n=1 Tax=Microtetraspora malaysiensis TaxID=161358 RepID=UPI003D8FC92C